MYRRHDTGRVKEATSCDQFGTHCPGATPPNGTCVFYLRKKEAPLRAPLVGIIWDYSALRMVPA